MEIEAERLYAKPKDEIEWRDVFVAFDLWQRYIELLDDMENNVHVEPESTIVSINNVTIKLKDVQVIGDWIYNGNQEP